MDRYLFSRNDWDDLAGENPATLSAHVFFQMWAIRADPYNRLEESDVVYIGDNRARRILWEVRPSSILRDVHYTSKSQALNSIRSVYGLYSEDLNGYHLSRPNEGWLMAWAPTVMRKMNVALPEGVNFGKNGYRRFADSEVALLGLPAPKRRSAALMSPPPWYAPDDAALTGRMRTVPRYIPKQRRDEVYERDDHRCVGCRTTTNLHIDHIQPWSKGGDASLKNLRLLCARSNLSKGAGLTKGLALCAR